MRAIAVGVVLAAGAPVAAQAQTAPARTIGIGDPSRAQLLDALRTVIAKDLGRPVKFVVDQMHVQAGWAFMVGPTDMGWMDWQETYRTPAGLIPQTGREAR